jgi:hypothetical protein
MARQTKNGARHRVKPTAGETPRVDDLAYPIQKAILTKSDITVDTLCVQLEDGSWIAVEMRPGNSGFGRTRAEAEESVRRRMSHSAGEDEDAMDLAATELHKREEMVPLESLVKKYRL